MNDVLFQINPLPTWIYEAQTLRILDVNSSAIALYGYSREDFLGLGFNQLDSKAGQPFQPASTSFEVATHRTQRGDLLQLEIHRHPTEFAGKAAVLAVGKVLSSTPQPAASTNTVSAQEEEYQRLKLFERIVTHTNDAVLVTEAEPVDVPGPRIVYVNEAFCKMTGYSAEEVIGKTPRMLQGPLSDFTELKALGQALREWQPYEVTTINYKKNGEPFWVNFSVTPIADSTGWFTHWIAIERDVTKSIELAESLTKAKETAEDNERKMKESQRLARLGSWYFDVIKNVSFWTEETYRIWGIDPNQPVISFAEHEQLIHPKDWMRFVDTIQNAIAKGTPYKMELEVLNADGTYKR